VRVSNIRIQNLKSVGDSEKLELGPITLLVGRNNNGKSVVIRGLHAMQAGGQLSADQVRYGHQNTVVRVALAEVNPRHWNQGSDGPAGDGTLTINFTRAGSFSLELAAPFHNGSIGQIPAAEPSYFIIPYLSSRKVMLYEEQIDAGRSAEIRANLSNLAPKVDRLMDIHHPRHADFQNLVRQVIGLPLTAIASPGGKQVGMWINEVDWIRLQQMGDGVAQMLGLITQICLARGRLFLIEEIENDIHPEGLKALLRVVEKRSAENQFVISTHSNIVLRYLGSPDSTVIYEITNEIVEQNRNFVPTSTIARVGNDVFQRSRLLASLGYEFSDFDLYDGWLILEEASAERIVRDHLVRWFAPKLSRVRTVASQGTSDVGRTFEGLHKMVLFTHLQERYRDRTLVLVDGDQSGKDAVARLQDDYTGWPAESFRHLSETDFELYYPEVFQARVAEVLALPKQEKRVAKRDLLEELLQWIDGNEEEARQAFEASSAEVIEHLRDLERSLEE
jgi:predicted ATPase